MTKAFNLLDEPWLPVRMLSGEVRDVGLLALFEQADQITALAETAPTSLMAEYRLLLAITHRALTGALSRWRERDLVNWFEQGLPTQAISSYLEQWRERFWLFHPDQPFMQVAALATTSETADKFKPWTQIDLASVSGNAPVVFNHSLDSTPFAISPAAALRSLLGFLQCIPGGLIQVLRTSDNAGPLANTAAVLPLGDTLARTLVLGLHPASLNREDLPSWERSPLTIADLLAQPMLATGPNDRYTRQTRSVLLLRGEEGSVCWLHFAAGQRLAEDLQAPDPMASYRASSNGQVRLTFSEGRALWRDLPALLPDGAGQSTPAAILERASVLNRVLGRLNLPLLVAGLACEPGKAKLLRWRVEQLQLPQEILDQPDATRVAREMVAKAEELFAKVKEVAVQLIADTLPDSQQKDTRKRARALFDASPVPPLFFAQAERSLMTVLARVAQEPDEAHLKWQQVLQNATLKAWDALLLSMGGSVYLWLANARAETRLRSAIKQHLDALYETGEV